MNSGRKGKNENDLIQFQNDFTKKNTRPTLEESLAQIRLKYPNFDSFLSNVIEERNTRQEQEIERLKKEVLAASNVIKSLRHKADFAEENLQTAESNFREIESLKKTAENTSADKDKKIASLTQQLEDQKRNPLADMMFTAIKADNIDDVRHLIALRGDLSVRNADGDNPLFVALRHSKKDIAKLLFAQNPDFKAQNINGKTILTALAHDGNVEMLNFTIDHFPKDQGIDFLVNAYDSLVKDGFKTREILDLIATHMLRIAVKQGNLTAVKLAVMEYPADVNSQDKTSETPLHKAGYFGYTQIVEFLLSTGARTDILDKCGQTVKQVSSKPEILALLKHYELLEHIKDANLKEVEKFFAANSGYNAYETDGHKNLLLNAMTLRTEDRHEMVALLINHGVHVNVEARLLRNGITTPLHEAVGMGDLKSAKLMIKAGASKHVQNNNGKTPLTLASKDMFGKMCGWFAKEEYKAKRGLNAQFALFKEFKKTEPEEPKEAKRELFQPTS